MKRSLLIITFLFFCIAAFTQSWEELNDQLKALSAKKDFKGAIPIAEKALVAAQKKFGELDPSYAANLNYLALLYQVTNQYEKAEPHFVHARDILKKMVGENHPNYITSLNNLAGIYEKMGHPEKAEPLYMEVVEIQKKLKGENHLDYVSSLKKLGEFYERGRQLEKAGVAYVKSLALLKIIVGENHTYFANGLNNLAYFYEKAGQYEKAEPLYLQAILIQKKIAGQELNYAANLDNLGRLYASMGQYNKAEPLHLQALEIRKKMVGENHVDYAVSLSNLGTLYRDLGQYDKAEPFYVQALEIRKKILGDKHPDYTTSLNNLAVLYEEKGQYGKAELFFMQAKEIDRNISGENSREYATRLNNLALLYLKLGQYDKAESYFLLSNKIVKNLFGENHPEYASSLGNLGGLYKVTRQYTRAEPLFSQANEIRKRIFGENHPDYANSLDNLGGVYLNMQQYARAEPLLVQANEIRKKILGENHPDYANGLSNLGGLYKDMGQYTKAAPFLVQAMEIRKKIFGENHPEYGTSLENLALLYICQGEFEKAESYILAGTRIRLKGLQNTFSIFSEKEKENYLNNNTGLIERNNSLLYNYPKASPALFRGNFDLQLFIKSISLSDTRSMLNAVGTSNDPAIQKLFKEWQQAKSLLAKEYSLPVNKRVQKLDSIETSAEKLEKELARRSAEFRDQQTGLQISMQDVQKNLESGEAAIEFVKFQLYKKSWTDSFMYAAYILRRNDPAPVFVPLCEERQLQQLFDSAGKTATAMVNQFYRGIEIKNKNAATLGKELYKLVWEPLEPYLKGISKISYSPAGKLYSIAFHSLPADSTTILIDKYELQQYTSARQIALRNTENQDIKPSGIVLFGDANFAMDSLSITKQRTAQSANTVSTPVYTPSTRSAQNNSWPGLPGTGEEVKKIADLFNQNNGRATTFTGTNASEENLKAINGISPPILHIATHGFFLPARDKKKNENGPGQGNSFTLADDPLLRSGLILSGGNYAWGGKTPIEGVEDGIVTAYEISQLNLGKTELVVLSACETALGDIKGSEGVFGLQRAFKMAGVKKLIVSLWQVPDKETVELMTSFYGYWMKGKTISESFYKAQGELRKKYSPFYWAAFVLVE